MEHKFNVFAAFFPYAGTGASAAEAPAVKNWWAQTVAECKKDPRVREVVSRDLSDTPITMTRNQSVHIAKQVGADILVMCDSDMYPDVELHHGDPFAKPFWKTAFDFFSSRWPKITVVGAPYCGPPPCENVYVFKVASWETDTPNADWRIDAFSREEAFTRSGIENVIALPTGLILFDMRAFDLIGEPYFYYEYKGDGPPCPHCGQRKPGPQAEKASTEDVTCTRDISFHGIEKVGYSPIHVAWDCWAGHWKPKCVRKPRPVTMEEVGVKYREAVLKGRSGIEKMTFLHARDGQPPARIEAVVK